MITSVLGFAFWVLAARNLTEEEVGIGAGLVAAVVLLGNASTLGLRNALPRFLPAAGPRTGHLIARSYAAVVVAGLVLGSLFVAGSAWWGDDFVIVRSGWLQSVGFVAAVALWAVFILQDNVLIGLRRAGWVPVENLVYAVVKLAMLVLIAHQAGWVVLVAWVVPAALLLGPLNIGIFRRLVPAASVGNGSPFDDRSTVPWRRIVRFAGGDHFADIVRYIGAEGVVLIVLASQGPEASAPLFFAITIAATLQLVSSNVMSAFVAEASARPDDASSLLRRSALRIGQFVVPAVVIAVVAAPIGLKLFGDVYAESATSALRLLLIAAIPQSVAAIATGWARFRQRLSIVVAIAVASAIGPVVGASFFASHGIVAVGWATLIGNSIIAVCLLSGVLRPFVLGSVDDKFIASLVSKRARIRQSRRNRAAATMFDELDATRSGRQALVPRQVIPTENDVVVALIEHRSRPLVAKVGLSASADAGIDRHVDAVTAMRNATAYASTTSLLPEIVETGHAMGQRYSIETACPGERRTDSDSATLGSVAAAFSALHRATARPTQPGDHIGYHVVHTPAQTLLESPRLAAHRPAIKSLADILERALIGHQVVTARTHGDCWIGNVLFDQHNDTPIVSAVVDWENSIERGLPEVDLAHLWLSSRRDGIASATLDSLTHGRFVDMAGPCATGAINTELPAGLVVTLAWLAHVADGLERSSRFSLGSVWLNRNVLPVLTAVDRGEVHSLIV